MLITHKVIEDVPLMDMDGDKGFELGSVHLGEVGDGDVNQCVQHDQEVLIGLFHHLFLSASPVQGIFSIPSPNHLDAEQSDLLWKGWWKIMLTVLK